MKRTIIIPSAAALAVCGVAFAAKGWLEVKPDKENVVGSRLVGKWTLDADLTKRLQDKMGNRKLEVEFTSNPDAIAKLSQAKYGPFLGKKRVYLAGELKIGPKTFPYLLTTHSGNPYVFYFRPRGGDPLGDSESFSLMLARGATPAQDLLFLGGDFNNQPFVALKRAGAAAQAPAKVDTSTPAGVVKAWIAAVKKGDKKAALALGTAAWKQREETWKKSFTRAIFGGGWTLLRCELRPAKVEGDKAWISGRAVFINDKGKEDPEGLRFRLEKIDGVWKIVDLG